MDVNLVPNIEPAQKFVDYFVRSVGKPFVPSSEYISVEGGIVVVDPQPKVQPGAKVELISSPEATRQQAEEILKEERSELSLESVKALKRQRKAQKSSGSRSGNIKKRKVENSTAVRLTDVFSS
jgi:hypothetical protein